ncbi:aldo/keto reductase [Bacillus sp. 165]|uniref:aldo/keto reductase n=1 Tax=Bacillus sp. 165 TaxID=1529117 RepID=UPI001ADD1F3A|nr:aldo/keto reductase [Bacillus sp. 165]MBO9128137.1 aldo/keto reductase [Bacillus sp. 165]
MNYITLKGVKGNKSIEKKCSRLILGTAGFYQLDDKEQAFKIMDQYVQMGGNIFDSAHQYINSEAIVGEWVESRGIRENIYILTKGAHPDDGEPGPRVNPEAITKDLMESLARLRTDYVDFYALHRDDPNVDIGPIMEVLNEHLDAGRIHAIGASNWSHTRIQEANNYAATHGLVGFTFNSPNLSLAQCNRPRWPGCVSVDEEMANWHKGTQLPLLSWSSQAGGFFSGRFSPEKRENQEMVEVYYSEANWERFTRAQNLAKEKGASTIEIALAYVLNQPYPTAAIIGPEKVEELLSSIKGANIPLTTVEIDELNLRESKTEGVR